MRPGVWIAASTVTSLFFFGASAARAQIGPSGEASLVRPLPPSADGSAPPTPVLHVDFSVTNAFDGNLTRDEVPLRSYGLAPGVSVRYNPPGPFEAGYDVAFLEYTATDRWDRVSHAVSASMTRRLAGVRLQTRAEGTWKVPADTLDLTRQAEVSERATVALAESTRLQLTAAWRYRYYIDHPETSGISPYLSGRLDRRFGDRHAVVGYRFQTRQSRARADRFRRQGYSVGFSTPVTRPDDELALEFEFRPQIYQGFIDESPDPVRRRDRRVVMTAEYERPVGARITMRWLAGFQKRTSNDPDKRFTDPTVALTLRYRWL